MSDQVTNKSTVAAQNQQRVMEIALSSSISTSDRLLRRIATLLFLLVAGMLTVFGYYASSICISPFVAGPYRRSPTAPWQPLCVDQHFLRALVFWKRKPLTVVASQCRLLRFA
jgi:hypothetical protein